MPDGLASRDHRFASGVRCPALRRQRPNTLSLVIPGFVILVVLVIVAIAITAGRRYMRRIAAAWGDAATVLGLQFEQPRLGRPRLSGTIGRMDVEVDVHMRRSGDSNQAYTRYRISWPSIGFDFRLTRQTGLSRIGRFFGAQDIEVGDPGFDDAFVVKTDSEDRLRALLGPGARGVLVRTGAAYPGVEFGDDSVEYEKRHLETSTDVIISTVRRLVDAATALTGKRRRQSAADVVAARERGELAEVAADLRDAVRARRDDLDEQLLEIDTLATAGEREAAADRIERLAEFLPADPDVRGWQERLAKPPREAARPTPESREVDPEGLARELFSGNSLSFESAAVFEEKFQGAAVRWKGRVKEVGRIRSGSDLGPEGATKLIATVATISHDLYGNTDIDAVVALPAGSGANLPRNAEVTFTGTLVGVDALVRNVLVAKGSLA
jgi:hypothetical protein